MLLHSKIIAIAIAIGAIVLAGTQSIADDDVISRLEGFKTLPEDYSAGRNNMRELFKLRDGLKADVAETIAKATAAGLVAIGDLGTYENVKKYVGNVRVLEATFSDECPVCNGARKTTCSICKGTGRSLKKSLARKQYPLYIDKAIAMLKTSSPAVGGTQTSPQNYGLGGSVPAYWRTFAPTVLTDSAALSHFLQGLSRNASGKSNEFKEHEFNFENYRQWRDKGATKIQKEKILERLFSKGFKTYFYKDFIRCYYALVPDGLSFAVAEINAWTDWHHSDYPNIKGPDVYCVTLDLLSYDHSYRTGSGSAKWTGQIWQSRDLEHFLRKEALLPGSRLSLLVPIDDENVESWKKGKILVSKGWVYDVQIWYGVGQTQSGNLKGVAEIHTRSTNVFRSIDERMKLENGFLKE